MAKKINLIPDIECNLDQENVDLMGTRPYVDVLEKMIEENIENYKPLTIGLFGRWGSGKSSIIKTLSERLSEKNSVKTVIYDAWKYSGDAFRRSFILEMKKQLELDWSEKLGVFYQDKHEDISTKIELVNKWWVIPVCFIPLVGLSIFMAGVDNWIKGSVSFLSIVSSMTLFLIKQLFVQYKISVTTPKFFSPEQFKEIFDEAVSDVTSEKHTICWWKKKEKRCKQIVIVFDNIDRCDGDTAKELLLNIKTYLEHNRCIVILPVDDSAIKSHLCYKGDEEADEFLRKIFNVSVRIKGLNNIDRYDFTRSLIEKYELGFSNEVASVISQEFAKNPRRIIQFLNSLAIEKEIASEQEAKRCIPKDSVTQNIDFLAKILLIKEEYSFLYDAILFDGLNLSKWEELYKEDKDRHELRMFFGRTSGIITPKNTRPYLMLCSKDDLVPSELINLIQAKQMDDVMAKIEKDSLDFNILLNYINEQLDTKLIKRGVTANPDLGFLIWCFAQDEINSEFEQRQLEFYRYFNYVKSEHIGGFAPVDVMKCAKFLKDQEQDNLYESIVGYVNSEVGVSREFLQEFIRTFPLTRDLNKVKKSCNEALMEDVTLFEDVLPYLKKANVGNSYINPETIAQHVKGLSVNQTENDTQICIAVRVCLSCGMLPGTIHDTFLINVLNFLKRQQSALCYKFWFDNIKGCMKIESGGSQLIQWLKQSFTEAVANRRNVQWKEALISMMSLLKECFVLGDNSVWPSISEVYALGDDLSVTANELLKQIVEKTEPNNWNFLYDVITKTSNVTVSNDYFVVLGCILKKGAGEDIVENNPDLLKNWLSYIVAKEDIGDDEKQLLKQCCKGKTFNKLCEQDLGVAKKLFAKAKEFSIKEVIDVTADIILQDASPDDIRYLIKNDYDAGKIKDTVQRKIDTSDDKIDWMEIIIDSEEIWEDDEYKALLEDRLVHLATGMEDEKQQAKELWKKVSKGKISSNNRSMIEKHIAEIEVVDIQESEANAEENFSAI